MTKSQLAENIIKSIEKNEWQQLHDGTLEVPAKTDGVICNYCVAKKLDL